MVEETQHTVAFDDSKEEMALLGNNDRHLKRLREAFGVQIFARDGIIRMRGQPQRVHLAVMALDDMLKHYRRSRTLVLEDVEKYIHAARIMPGYSPAGGPPLAAGAEGLVEPRTKGQERYLAAMEQNEVVFCIGPAGTGKTYLAVAQAVGLLRAGIVKKIILARPAVEAGEKLGFLPGDLQEKVNPFLRPLYDALLDMLDYNQFKRYMERDIIEVVPLAYMRGRTLNHAFVILDEAQNSTGKQMKMFLTRLGQDSRAVITGDITQIDLPEGESSGLLVAEKILRSIQDLCFVYLDEKDVVRHRIVQDIVVAYEKYEEQHPSSSGRGRAEPERDRVGPGRSSRGSRTPAQELPRNIDVEEGPGPFPAVP